MKESFKKAFGFVVGYNVGLLTVKVIGNITKRVLKPEIKETEETKSEVRYE